MHLRWRRRERRLLAPLHTGFGVLESRVLIEVELEADDGLTGRGEAAPLEPYDGVSLEAGEAGLQRLADLIAGSGEGDTEALLDAAWASGAPAPAVAALDLCLHDLAGLRAGQPVAALLSRAPRPEIEVNATIAAPDRAAAAAAADRAQRAGFRCLKVKVGLGDDAGRLAAVRAAVGRETRLRVDANGAWGDPVGALAALEVLAPVGLELAEEPVHGVEALRALRASAPVPIAMDETATDAGAWASGATDLVCLKLARCGGIAGVVAAARAARAAGSEVYLASSFDGPAGIAGALHAAAALGALPACGLATLGLFAESDRRLPVRDGRMAVPDGPGLGLGLG